MPIIHKRNTVAGTVPTTASLSVGELAINVADGKVFTRRSGSGTDITVSLLSSYANNTGSYTITGSLNVTGSSTIVGNETISGSLILSGLPSASFIDRASNAAVYANGATVDFSNFSGMIVFNNTTNTGIVTLVLCGGGSVYVLGASGTSGSTGSFSAVAGINGYRWTNDTGVTISASFAAIRTRPAI